MSFASAAYFAVVVVFFVCLFTCLAFEKFLFICYFGVVVCLPVLFGGSFVFVLLFLICLFLFTLLFCEALFVCLFVIPFFCLLILFFVGGIFVILCSFCLV